MRLKEVNGPHLHPLFDLLSSHLDGDRVVNLTQNTQHSGASTEPSLWRHYLLFKQSPSPYLRGDIVLWDLSADHFPLWRKAGEWVLDRRGEMPLWGDGLAWWQAADQVTAAVFLADRGRVWTLQNPRHMGLPQYQRYDWTLLANGGRSIVAERDPAGRRGHPKFFLWSFDRGKGSDCRKGHT